MNWRTAVSLKPLTGTKQVHDVLQVRSPANTQLYVALHIERPKEFQNFAHAVLREQLSSISWSGKGSDLEEITSQIQAFVSGLRFLKIGGDTVDLSIGGLGPPIKVSIGGIARTSEGSVVYFRRGLFRVLVDGQCSLPEETSRAEGKSLKFDVPARLAQAFQDMDNIAARSLPADPLRSEDLVVASELAQSVELQTACTIGGVPGELHVAISRS